MITHSLLYSNNQRYRLLRHMLFWVSWFAYLIIIDNIHGRRMGSASLPFGVYLEYTLTEMLILLSVDILFCYAVIYFLIPRMLLRQQYFLFFLFLSLFLLLDASLSSYFYTWIINPLRRQFALQEYKYVAITDLLYGLNSTMMITAIAAIIRFLKMWHIKKEEVLLVKSEKTTWELKFIDTFIQPSFLPVLLRKIHSYSLAAAPKVPEMLEKLQRILAYLIDECNQPTVLLQHEITAIKDFIQLERLTNTDRLSIQVDQSGEAGTLRIVPYILFPFVENNFRQVNDNITDKHWTTLQIQIEGTRVSLHLKNSKPVETSNLMNYETQTLQQMKKRLDLLYPASYKFNIVIEENVFGIFLDMDLSKLVQ